MTNPLLAPWDTPFALPPFDRIRDEDFAPAFDAALAASADAVRAIAGDPAPATFDNTVAAMELAEATLDRVAGVFYNIAGADSNPAREALQTDLAPRLSAHSSEILMNRALFARIEDLWTRRDDLGLDAEQLRVLTLYRRMFLRAGAQLEGEAAERFRAVKDRLASLGTAFSQAVLAEERDWSMDLSEGDLEGLPDFVVAGLAAAAEERGRTGWVLTLSRSLIVPFLQFSSRRDLRERAYEAWTARGANGNAADTRAIVAETLALRDEMARLLGYANYAAYKLEPEMAKSADTVRGLLTRVWTAARAQAARDAQALTERMHADGVNGDLEPWDWRYYSARRRAAEHDLDETALKPYLELNSSRKRRFAVWNAASRMAFSSR